MTFKPAFSSVKSPKSGKPSSQHNTLCQDFIDTQDRFAYCEITQKRVLIKIHKKSCPRYRFDSSLTIDGLITEEEQL